MWRAMESRNLFGMVRCFTREKKNTDELIAQIGIVSKRQAKSSVVQQVETSINNLLEDLGDYLG